MLPETFKFRARNALGTLLDIAGSTDVCMIEYQLWKRDAYGALSFSTEQSASLSADLADTADAAFAEYDNSSNLYEGLHGMFTVTTDDAAAAGVVELYLEWSTDGGTTYPSGAGGFDVEKDALLIAVLDLSGSQTRRINFAVS